jgi:CRP-like cAMP-binding protein
MTESAPQDHLPDLRDYKFLRLLSAEQASEVLNYSKIISLKARQTLFREGDSGSALYVLTSGYVKLTRMGPDGTEIVLELAGPRSIFGEIAAIGGARRAADAVAISACKLLAIDARQFMAVLRQNEAALLEIFQLLTDRLRNTTSRMEDLLFLPLTARLARALIRLAALNSRPTRDGLLIDVTLSQRELGELTGLARESINKQLATWRDEGVIAMTGKSMILKNIGSLNAIAQLDGANISP